MAMPKALAISFSNVGMHLLDLSYDVVSSLLKEGAFMIREEKMIAGHQDT